MTSVRKAFEGRFGVFRTSDEGVFYLVAKNYHQNVTSICNLNDVESYRFTGKIYHSVLHP